jgi:methylated-DNA-[protein]-cysteine S-methyltransferase
LIASRKFRSDPGSSDPGFSAVIAFPKFKLGVVTRDGRVTRICYLPAAAATLAPQDPLAERAARQLERYRDDPDTVFDLPLAIEGSALQKAVWRAMCAIPRGRTRTYGELARELSAEARIRDDGTLARAVGQACGDNRLPIVIPCHRVVAADGIGGFGHSTGGYLIEAKRWLLLHEAPSHEFALRP